MGKKDAATSVADVLGPYLARQCRTMLETGAELRAALVDDGDLVVPAELVHRSRTSCRRIRSIVKVYEEFFAVPQAGRLSDDTGWYATQLGAVRDLDVLGERLGAAIDRLEPGLVLHRAREELTTQLQRRRAIALAQLRDAMHSQAYADLADQLRSWQQGPPYAAEAAKPATKIKKYLKRSERKLDRRLRTAALAVAADDDEVAALIHTARRTSRRHGYAVEAAAPVLGPSTDRLVQLHREVTDRLGAYQDSRIAAELLRDLGGVPGRNGFTFGLLYAQEAERRRRLGKRIGKQARNL